MNPKKLAGIRKISKFSGDETAVLEVKLLQ